MAPALQPRRLPATAHALSPDPPDDPLDQIGCAVQELYVSRQVREQSGAAGGASSACADVAGACLTVASFCVVTAAAVQAAEAAWRSLSLACEQLQAAASTPASAAAEKQNHPVGTSAARLSDARGIYESLSSVLAAAQVEAWASSSKITLNLSGAPVVYAGACRAVLMMMLLLPPLMMMYSGRRAIGGRSRFACERGGCCAGAAAGDAPSNTTHESAIAVARSPPCTAGHVAPHGQKVGAATTTLLML